MQPLNNPPAPPAASDDGLEAEAFDIDEVMAPAEFPSRLDPLETNPQLNAEPHISFTKWRRDTPCCTSILPSESHLRHSCWARRRNLTWAALQRAGVSENRLDAFANCGSGLHPQVRADGQDMRLVANHCNDRFCVPCGNRRAATILTNLRARIGNRKLLFISLTLRHSPTPLVDQLKRLVRSFVELRRTKLWTSNVKGGAAFIEVKISERDGLWHPHLHVLADGLYMPTFALSQAWHRITGDSTIVDIRRPDNGPDVERYVVKYVTKPADSTVFRSPDRLCEMILAMKRQHLCSTFGQWRGWKLLDRPKDTDEWINLRSPAALQADAAAGDEQAIRWLQVLARKYPLFAHLFTIPPPPPEQTLDQSVQALGFTV